MSEPDKNCENCLYSHHSKVSQGMQYADHYQCRFNPPVIHQQKDFMDFAVFPRVEPSWDCSMHILDPNWAPPEDPPVE